MTFDSTLDGLRAAAEPTRLRILALCAEAELSVRELTQILGQSQPRVSRHLKVLCEARVLDRSQEGTSVYFRLAQKGECAELARQLTGLLSRGESDDAISLDRSRLEQVKRMRAEAAAAYFKANAAQWDQIRSLHVDETEVERALISHLTAEPIGDFLDIGTGTGRILEIFGPHIGNGVGIDFSREMLALARARLERAGLRNCTLRQGDMYQLPWPDGSFDAAVIHQVLHYAEDPPAAIAEAARILRPRGRLAIVDFAPHELADLREGHAHRHLGFGDPDLARWCRNAGLTPMKAVHLAGKPLTVTLWVSRRPGDAIRTGNAHDKTVPTEQRAEQSSERRAEA